MIEQIVIHLSMEQKLINSKFKAKNSGLVASLLCLANISKDWSVDNIKQGLMVISMILVLIILLLQLMILKTSTNI